MAPPSVSLIAYYLVELIVSGTFRAGIMSRKFQM